MSVTSWFARRTTEPLKPSAIDEQNGTLPRVVIAHAIA
jgi:hypothetical protein